MGKHITLALLGIVLLSNILSLTGCATAHRYVYGLRDTRGEDKLVCIDRDLYIEKVYTGEKRRLTHTPDMSKANAYFVLDGKYIVYEEEPCAIGIPRYKFYIIPSDSDDKDRKEITRQEFGAHIYNR